MKKVVSIGAYTLDLFMMGPRLPKPGETVDCPEYAEADGGKGANQAVAAARLGASAAFITRFGDDADGRRAQALMQSEGIDTSGVVIDETAKTGVGFIILDSDGGQMVTTFAGASQCLCVDDLIAVEPMIKNAEVLLLQGEIGADVSLEAAKMAGEDTVVILDPGPVEQFLGKGKLVGIDILTPNVSEAEMLAGQPVGSSTSSARVDPAVIAAATGVPTVIVTSGGDGIFVYHDGATHHVPATVSCVVDSTGAGDCFNGALSAALVRGCPLMDAVKYACRCASICVSRRFCIPSYPYKSEID